MNRSPRLTTFSGNRLEMLAARLCAGLRADPLPPQHREQVVVPSRGMGAWLERQVALDAGIAASIDFPFPARFVDDLAAGFGLGRPEPVDPFRPVAQLFELHELFWEIEKGELQATDLKPVAEHLDGDVDGRKRYQLARRVSGLYGRYQFERPLEIQRWLQGGWFGGDDPDLPQGEPWQRALFNQLAERHAPERPPARRILDLLRILESDDVAADLLPSRLAVFGASTMPRMIAAVFVALSRHLPVDVYLLSPTPDYIGDFRGRDHADGQRAAAQDLVAVLGKLGREFIDVMVELDDGGASVEAIGFEDASPVSVLEQLQFAMQAGEPDPAFTPDPADRSLRMHSCHSPLREMEVLRDEVLAALADGTADSVSEVLLLVPDIRTYAPFARSVFGAEITNEGRELRLPLRVADRAGTADQPYVRLILRWLELAAARLTLSEVFPALQEEVVLARFGFASEQLDALRDRLADAGVIWGVDPQWRAERTGSPPFAGVSWRDGVDRLLLGCFTGPVDAMVDGVLPAADAAVGDVDVLGELATALDDLFELLAGLQGPHPMEEWVRRLAGGLNALTDAADEAHAIERSKCMEILERLATDAAGSSAPLGRLAILDLLGREFAAMESGRGLVSGAITVAELRPMRSLPAQVIAVAGMDAESFPRRDPRDGLDLVRENPRPGDRSPRDDDRQLFLELLLCARRRLILSWVGRDQREDHERTISPCAQEVIDTLEDFGFTGHTVEHSLQPFASSGYKESTYDDAAVMAAAAHDPGADVVRFVDRELPPPERPGVDEIRLDDLQRFWKSPSQWFCTRGAGIAMAFERDEPEAEALGLDALQTWKLRDGSLRDPGTLEGDARLRARFGLPANALVDADFGELRGAYARLTAMVGFSPEELLDEEVSIELDDCVVRGTLQRCPDGRMAGLVAGSLKPKYKVPLLVAHALAGCAGFEGSSLVASMKELDKVHAWGGFADPRAVLSELVAGFRRGHTAPLRFFPHTTFAFIRQRLRGDADPATVWSSPEVQAAWAKPADPNRPYLDVGDVHDEAVALCMRGITEAGLCDDEFVRWADRFAGWIEDAGVKP